MKVYMVEIGSGYEYAQIHAQLGQNIEKTDKINIMWNDASKWQRNIVPDFIFSMYMICRESVAKELINRFKGLETREVLWDKNPKELIAKDLNRLKWLPKEDVQVSVILTNAELPILPRSTVNYGPDRIGKMCIKSINGVSELIGETVSQRDSDKGVFFSKEDVRDYDFFRPVSSPDNWIFCTERVKKYMEEKNYSNLYFQRWAIFCNLTWRHPQDNYQPDFWKKTQKNIKNITYYADREEGRKHFFLPIFLSSDFKENTKSYARYKFVKTETYAFGRLIEADSSGGDLIEIFRFVGNIPDTKEIIINSRRLIDPIRVCLGFHKKRWQFIFEDQDYDKNIDSDYRNITFLLGDPAAPKLWQGGIITEIKSYDTNKYNEWIVYPPTGAENLIKELQPEFD